MGLVGGVLHSLQVGAEMLLPTAQGLGTLLRDPRTATAQVVLGVPMHFDVISRSTSVTLPDLRLAVSAGEVMKPEVWSRFGDRFAVPVSPVYGTTETGIIAADLVSACPPPWVGSVLPSTRVEVVDGEVLVHVGESPYLGADPVERVVDGWLRTFDRGTLTPDRRLAVHGRADSLVTIGGLKVDLQEVEAVLTRHPGVDGAVVVHDTSIRAYVASARSTVRTADLIAWCREHLSGFKIPATFIVGDTLPRTVSGKAVRDPEVLRRHAAEQPSPVGAGR